MPNTTTSQGQLMYAVEDCSRCGGSGEYSYCQRFGTVCFKCQGKGTQLTRAAVKARELVAAWRAERSTIPLSEVTEGQLIRARAGDKLRRVTEIVPAGQSGNATIHADGTRTELVGLHTKGMTYCLAPDATVLRQLTVAERAELETYMETLPGVYRAS